MTESQKDTQDHIAKVQYNLLHVICLLADRSREHDASKLEEPELSGYEGLSQAAKNVAYGTPEYKEALAPFKEIIQHHYAHNQHHPEHWPNGVADMSLLDTIEMLCDWKAAHDRKGGPFGPSLAANIRRFNMSDQLGAILVNTAAELGWL
jgi:hypothetical protein